MATYLDEDQAGTDPNCIAYPHLLLCMGVTVLMDDSSFIGAHFTTPVTEDDNIANMRDLIQASNAAPLRMYLVGNFAEHFGRHGGKTALQKAAALGFHGHVYSFDTAVIKPKDGTFARLTSRGTAAHPQVEYKRNEKVQYTSGVNMQGRDNVVAIHAPQARFFSTAAIPYAESKIGFHILKDKKWIREVA